MRLGAVTLAVFASAVLSVQAAPEELTLCIGGNAPTFPSIAIDGVSPPSDLVSMQGEYYQVGQGGSIAQPAVTLGYTQKYGTKLNDSLTGITTDTQGNVFISGNSVDTDSSGFLRKYSTEGLLIWDKAKPTTSIDGVTLDKNGNAYIVGSYVSGTGSSIRHYIYLEKYDSDGNFQWTKSIRAESASDPTRMIANGIATDPNGNNLIVILYERAYWPYQTREVFLRKYNVSGVPIWEKPVGQSSPYTARPILTMDHNGNAYTAINTAFNQQWNIKISQFDSKGAVAWSTTFYPTASSQETYVHGIAADPTGNVYVTGITKANLEGENLGYFDAFVRKYDTSSAILWTRQFGSIASDYANSQTTDAAGNVYVVGSTMGDLKGKNRGSYDATIRKYGSHGDILQTRQFGSPEFDIANGAKVDASGNFYVAGHTYGRLGGAKVGQQDVYFRKYTSF